MFGRMVHRYPLPCTLLTVVLGAALTVRARGEGPTDSRPCSTGVCAVHDCAFDPECPGKAGCDTGLEEPYCRFCGGPFDSCPAGQPPLQLKAAPTQPSLRALSEGCNSVCTYEGRTKSCKDWVHSDERLFQDARYAICIHAYAEVLAQCDSCLIHCPAHEVGCSRYVPQEQEEGFSFPFGMLLLVLLIVGILVAGFFLARTLLANTSRAGREDSRVLMAEKTVPSLKETVRQSRQQHSPRPAAGDQAVNDTVRLLTSLDAVGEEEQDWQPPPPPPEGKEETYFADNTQLHAQSYGLVHRATKNENDTVTDRTRWGQQVTGIDCGDGWVYLPATNHYLPTKVCGVQVLTKVNQALEALPLSPRTRPVTPKSPASGKSPRSRTPRRGDPDGDLSPKSNQTGKMYELDNSLLKATSVGLRHRKSKNDKDLAVQASKWGEEVEGIDCGDGWVKLVKTGTYLPLEVRGLRVLVLQE